VYIFGVSSWGADGFFGSECHPPITISHDRSIFGSVMDMGDLFLFGGTLFFFFSFLGAD
jgi:hypothetical protein